MPSDENRPLKGDGFIWPDWLALIKDYPGRFVLGGDVATSNPNRNTAANIAGTWALLNQLPQDLPPSRLHVITTKKDLQRINSNAYRGCRHLNISSTSYFPVLLEIVKIS
jgi:hypothetical protein